MTHLPTTSTNGPWVAAGLPPPVEKYTVPYCKKNQRDRRVAWEGGKEIEGSKSWEEVHCSLDAPACWIATIAGWSKRKRVFV